MRTAVVSKSLTGSALLSALFTQGNARVTIILDQLNTHMSELMVKLVAELSGVPLPDRSVMSTMKARRAWLEEPREV